MNCQTNCTQDKLHGSLLSTPKKRSLSCIRHTKCNVKDFTNMVMSILFYLRRNISSLGVQYLNQNYNKVIITLSPVIQITDIFMPAKQRKHFVTVFKSTVFSVTSPKCLFKHFFIEKAFFFKRV